MDKKAVLDRITATGVIPVIRAQSADEAAAAIAAIQAGGLSILEITMTVPGAVDLIRDVARRASAALVGAGTVLDPETARAVIDAGARFVVSPALNLDTIAACREAGVPVLPGALTPTEVVSAWRAGADLVKVFPANAVGGPSYIRSLKAPLPQVGLVPTGGVNLQTAKDFIKAGAAALGVGADLVDLAALRKGDAALVTERARQFLALVQEARAC
ncbi:MAG TPA: bifunctional 4-hydroxy-2-oxoglutarate aldolase/2-dehydro-3-deoxy-phosphogluconate aldolase [Vicinamibacteria bacterium]|nr:bifunctional 4-hydroxy-2-oxoglutarate aldolase/2-dehydro-3-deoxy-phosphogluconate aldolase [Vicinamibacteria bacterium]